MIHAPYRHRPGHEASDLRDFLAFCRDRARASGVSVLASVSLAVRHIDPLAVLLSTRNRDEPWYYRESPGEDVAVAAIGAADSRRFSGPARLAVASDFLRERFRSAVAAGDAGRAFGGPIAFVAAEFDPEGALSVFFPARMVARVGGEHTAVANVLMGPDSDPAAEAARLLAAHARFASFDYAAEPDGASGAVADFSADLACGEAGYASLVARALEGIRAGDFEKVVPARAVDLRPPAGFDAADTLEFLRARHTGAHTFSFGFGDGVEWLGATPETLLRVRSGELKTEALAGTGPRARHASADAAAEAALLSDEKIAREQRAVTRDILERLGALGLDAEAAPSPRVLRLAHTRHLLTPVTSKLGPEVDALRAAGALHPTPAVCGTPREAALGFLKAHEGFAREHYAGFSGWMDSRGDAHFLVNLRCAKVDESGIRLYAGAGVVEGSVPGDEAAETTLKLRTVAEALAGS